MRKTTIYLALASFIVGAIVLVSPKTATTTSVAEDDSKAAYVQLFNEKFKAFPKPPEVEVKGPKGRNNEPNMFAEMDKLKRMNAQTGEVPADGYQRAYDYFLEEFGQPNVSADNGNTNNGLFWDERGPTGIGGRTRAILWDPNSATNKGFFAGGVGGGMWHTDDVTVNNPSWTQVSPLFANVAATCINVDPSNTQVMYFGTGEGWFNADAIRGAGVWKSVDGGMSWAQLPSTANTSFYYCQGIEVTSNGVVYIATKGGLWRSDDGGVTMTHCLGLQNGASNDYMTDIEQAGNGDLYVGVSGSGIYKSAAGAGQGLPGNWTRLTTGFQTGFSRIEIGAGHSNSDYIYAICEVNNASSPVYRSTNGGTTWSATSGQPNNGQDISNGQAWYDLCIQVDPNDHNTVYCGGIDQHRSQTGGSSWTKLTAAYGGFQPYIHADQHYILLNPANTNQLVFAGDGGIWYSSNKGSSVSEHNNNYNVTQLYSVAIDPRAGKNKMIGGAQDNGSMMVDNPGIGNGIGLTGSDGAYVAINALHPDTMFTTTQYRTVRRTRNNGATFASITNPNLSNNDVMFINPLEIDPVNPNNLYQASTSLWRHPNASSGSGASWSRVSTVVGSQISAIAPGYNPSTTVYFASGGTVYRIPNVTFANFQSAPENVNSSGLGTGYINCISVNPNDNNHIVITYTSFGNPNRVMECRNADQGSNAVWKTLTGNLPDVPCNWAAFEPNNPDGILLGTDMGMFRCTDISQPANNIYWSPESLGLGIPRVEQIRVRYSDNVVFIGTHGRGFFSTNSYNLVPQANFAALNPNACGGDVQFTDSTANAPLTWAWDFGDGGTSTLQHPNHNYAASGTYTVTLTTTNPNGSDVATQTITVNVLPNPVAIAGPDTTGCPGDTIQLSSSGGVSYSWAPAGALINPTSSNPQFVVTSSRTLIVTVMDANGCTDTDTTEVTANAAPSIWAGQDQTITTLGGSVNLSGSGGTTYLWSPATGLSCTSCPDPVASPTVTTTYTCTGFSAAGCPRSDEVTVNVNIVGIDPAQNSGFSIDAVLPQPMHSNGTIRYTLPVATTVSLDLIDLSGKRVVAVHEGMGSVGENQIGWERNGLAAGLYFLRLKADDISIVKKVVLQ